MSKKRTIEGERLFRTAVINRAEDVDQENRTVELSFSSEEPVDRWFGIEILDHDSKSVRLGRLQKSGPLLMDHNPRDHVGVVESVEIGEDRKGRATVRFGKSTRAEEVFQDVLDGIRVNVSVGYIIYKVEETKAEKGKPETVRAVDWEPLEISLVSVPADTAVGVGRDLDPSNESLNENPEESEEEQMRLKDKRKFEADKGIEGGPATVTEPKIDVGKERDKAMKDERHRATEITAMGEKFQRQAEAKAAIETGMSIDAFRGQVLDSMSTKSETDPNPDLGLSEKEVKDYSVLRAINAVVGNIVDGRSASCFEMECSQEIEKKFGKTREKAGFFVPHEVTQEKRDMQANVDTAGGYLVQNQYMSMIELLRNSMMVAAMGAQVLNGLKGDLYIPKQTGGGTAYWLNEGQAPAKSQQIIGQLGMTPKTVGAYTDLSRKLIMQSSIDVENMVRSDLMTILALEKDRVAINGTGSNGEPLGILNTTGIGSVVTGGTIDWAKIVKFETLVATANALLANLGYLANAQVVGLAKTVVKAANTAQFLMEGKNDQQGFGEMNGYRVGRSNQVPNNLGGGSDKSALIFGNWNDLIIGNWGTLDVQVDPYTGSTSGTVRIVVLQDTDTRARRAQSFASAVDITNP